MPGCAVKPAGWNSSIAISTSGATTRQIPHSTRVIVMIRSPPPPRLPAFPSDTNLANRAGAPQVFHTMIARQFSLLPHRSVIAVGGPDRADFLQGLISNDTTKVAPGQAIWAALLTPQGRFLNDMFVVDGGSDMLLLETERERAAGLAKKLAMYKLRSKVVVEDRSGTQEVAVAFGP